LAVSPYAIWHSQDARMYSISMALTLASTSLLVTALQRGRLWAWAGYVALCWMALHVHYFAAFVLLAQGVYVAVVTLSNRQGHRDLIRWLGAMALLALFYLPWLAAARDTLAGYRGNGDSPGFASMLERALSVFALGETMPAEQRLWWAIVAGALLAMAAYRLAQSGPAARRALLLLGLYLGVPVLVTWLSALDRPIFNERYLIAAAPPFYLLLAAAVLGHGGGAENSMVLARGALRTNGADSRGLSIVAAALLAVLELGMLASLGRHYGDPAYSKTRGWRELARTMMIQAAGVEASRVRLAQSYPDPVLWYYTGPVSHLVLPPAAHDQTAAQREVSGMAKAGVDRVVLAVQPDAAWDPNGIAQSALSEQYTAAASQRVAGWQVETYVLPADAASATGVAFANGLTLDDAAIQNERLEPGGLLAVSLLWRGDAARLTGSEKITVQLLDEAGALVAQTDAPFPAESLAEGDGGSPRAYAVQVPWKLPSGSYRVILALYDPGQEGAARILTSEGADHVTLGALATS
jgi:hypothetical protein